MKALRVQNYPLKCQFHYIASWILVPQRFAISDTLKKSETTFNVVLQVQLVKKDNSQNLKKKTTHKEYNSYKTRKKNKFRLNLRK